MAGLSRIGPGILQVIYVSTATAPLAPEELKTLSTRARARNAAQGLTGFLFHQPPRFYGVLEGPERKVLARMEAIVTDPRHRGLTVLREERVAEARYRNWAFGLLPQARPGSECAISAEFVYSLAGLGGVLPSRRPRR